MMNQDFLKMNGGISPTMSLQSKTIGMYQKFLTLFNAAINGMAQTSLMCLISPLQIQMLILTISFFESEEKMSLRLIDII